MITNDTGPVLYADNLRTDSNMSLGGATLTGAGEHGAVRLIGAQVGGQLDLDRAVITNDTGPVLYADRLRTDDSLFLRSATLRGVGKGGAVRLIGANIGSQLDVDRTGIVNGSGIALHADRLHTDNNMFLRGATVTGVGEQGAVRLIGAHIGYQLSLDRVEIINDLGPALDASGLRTDGDMFLRDAAVTGKGDRGAIWLPGAHIDGRLHLDGIRVVNKSGLLMDLGEASVAAGLYMSASVVCPYARAEIGRSVCTDSERRISAQGLEFRMLSGMSWRQWLHLLMRHTPAYGPQPYQQLAAIEKAAGHDNNARQILIAQQEDLRRRTPEVLGGRLANLRHWLWGWLGRYGYRAHRLVAGLTLVLTLAAGMGYVAGQIPTRPGHYAAERLSLPTRVPQIGVLASPRIGGLTWGNMWLPR